MKRRFLFSALLSALVFGSGALQCQQLTVQTDSGKQVVLSRTDLEGLPHIKVTTSEHSSGPVNFERPDRGVRAARGAEGPHRPRTFKIHGKVREISRCFPSLSSTDIMIFMWETGSSFGAAAFLATSMLEAQYPLVLLEKKSFSSANASLISIG